MSWPERGWHQYAECILITESKIHFKSCKRIVINLFTPDVLTCHISVLVYPLLFIGCCHILVVGQLVTWFVLNHPEMLWLNLCCFTFSILCVNCWAIVREHVWRSLGKHKANVHAMQFGCMLICSKTMKKRKNMVSKLDGETQLWWLHINDHKRHPLILTSALTLWRN